MPESNATDMPFTKYLEEVDAQWLKDHPDRPDDVISKSDVAKVIMEQEAHIAEGHAQGRISDADFSAFRDASQVRLDTFKEEVRDGILDHVEALKPAVEDLVGNFQGFVEEHPGLMQTFKGSDEHIIVPVKDVADTVEFAVEAGNSLTGPVMDFVESTVDTVHDGLSAAASDVVDARAVADPANADAAHARLEAARETFDVQLEAAHGSIDAARDSLDHDFSQAQQGVDAMREFADSHPDAVVEVHSVIADPEHTFEVDHHISDA